MPINSINDLVNLKGIRIEYRFPDGSKIYRFVENGQMDDVVRMVRNEQCNNSNYIIESWSRRPVIINSKMVTHVEFWEVLPKSNA